MALAEGRPTGHEADLIDELRGFLDDNWNPDLSVGEWWERLGMSGWAAPMLPADAYGRGLSRPEAVIAQRVIAQHGALAAPDDMGIWLAAPTIAAHGSRDQIDRFIPAAVCGRTWWCQLFSEPGAGSDLAGLTTKAVRDGDVWVVNGQKVWTSGGDMADMGMLLARTDPTAPKHRGISWFALDMHQRGRVEVRPLKEMTGSSYFSEVFLSDALVKDSARIGEANDGWAVANTTLFHERSGAIGGGSAEGAPRARPGTVAGDLSRRAGDFVSAEARSGDRRATRKSSSPAGSLIALARERGIDTYPTIRQALAQAHILRELSRLNIERGRALRSVGREISGLASLSKLLDGDIQRHERDLAMSLLGARGMLHAYTRVQRATLADAPLGAVAHEWTAQALAAQALPIYGGTDQIQRNIVGERVLGLPKEPGDLSRRPFHEIPRNS